MLRMEQGYEWNMLRMEHVTNGTCYKCNMLLKEHVTNGTCY